MTKLSLKRNITSYHKVRLLISKILRGKKFQAKKERVQRLSLLQIGCGPCPNFKFINLDYDWQPGVDIVWDINQPLPFESNTLKGIFTEHCLEHFGLSKLDSVLKEFYRILKPNGYLRIVVPDLKKYVAAYWRRLNDLSCEEDALSSAKDFNRVFYVGHEGMVKNKWLNNGHHYIHDYESMHLALSQAGFKKIKEQQYGQGECDDLLIDRQDRSWESLYVEAQK